MTVWFWDPYFYIKDNWVTRTQLLQKVNTFTDAQEGNDALRAGGENFKQDYDDV